MDHRTNIWLLSRAILKCYTKHCIMLKCNHVTQSGFVIKSIKHAYQKGSWKPYHSILAIQGMVSTNFLLTCLITITRSRLVFWDTNIEQVDPRVTTLSPNINTFQIYKCCNVWEKSHSTSTCFLYESFDVKCITSRSLCNDTLLGEHEMVRGENATETHTNYASKER